MSTREFFCVVSAQTKVTRPVASRDVEADAENAEDAEDAENAETDAETDVKTDVETDAETDDIGTWEESSAG